MYTNNRDAYRQVFFTVWQKHLKKLPLEPIEAQLLDVILLHPEFHRFMDHPDSYQKQEFALEENPFFHMSLHLAIREQIRTNRPVGVAAIYQQLLEKEISQLESEHLMMDCLIQMMGKAQTTGNMPSDDEYLALLKARVRII